MDDEDGGVRPGALDELDEADLVAPGSLASEARLAGDEAVAALARVTAHLVGGEQRPEQQEMCRAVAEALVSGRHLAVQAGTGTGKSLAYLVPAALSGKKVVVATATKALQDQLAEKDLPQVAAGPGRAGGLRRAQGAQQLRLPATRGRGGDRRDSVRARRRRLRRQIARRRGRGRRRRAAG